MLHSQQFSPKSNHWLWEKVYSDPLLHQIYKIVKYLRRLFTGTTEIQRLCTSNRISALPKIISGEDGDEVPLLTRSDNDKEMDISVDTVFRVDLSIYYSKELTVESALIADGKEEIERIISGILTKKMFLDETSPQALILRYCIYNIVAAQRLIDDVNSKTRTKYDKNDEEHEQNLMELWRTLMPNTTLEGRLTKQWQDLGFQGKDPATDFRGMGILGLHDLLFFAKRYPLESRRILNESRESDSWYSFAIVGINITAFAVEVLKKRKLQYFLFRYGTSIDIYQEFYCYIYKLFHDHWTTRKPKPSIMDFEMVFGEVKSVIYQRLIDRDVCPLDDLGVENPTKED